MNNTSHPLAEIIGRKLFGIESVSKEEMIVLR